MHVFLNIFFFFNLLYFTFVFNSDIIGCDIPSGSPLPLPSLSHRSCLYKGQNLNLKKHEIKINCYDALQIFILSLGVFTLIRLSLLHLCTHVSYVTFNTDLNLYSKKKTLLVSTQWISAHLSLVVLGLFLLR